MRRGRVLHSELFASDDAARAAVKHFFPTAKATTEDDVTYWADDQGAVAFQDVTPDGVHVVFVARCDAASLLRSYTHLGEAIVYDGERFVAFAAGVVRSVLQGELVRPFAKLIPPFLRASSASKSDVVLLPVEADGRPVLSGTRRVVVVTEDTLALARRAYRSAAS